MYQIQNATIFDGVSLKKKQNVLVENNKILEVSTHVTQDPKFKFIDAKDGILAPGFIDLQVNGGGGVFWNDAPSVESLEVIVKTHLNYGTTALLPTLISDDFSKMKEALQATENYLSQKKQGILGIHLEGPFLNPEKNGIHEKKFIRAPKDEEIQNIVDANIPIKLVTLAPEMVSETLIQNLAQHHVFVFAGHTNASYEKMEQSFAKGVHGITHFFNACSPFLSRAPGVVGAGLAHENIWCGLIADGIHVDFRSIKIAFQAKGTHHFFLVSDAMAPVGTSCSQFDVHGQTIFVQDEKYLDKNGVLAGSSLTMHKAFKNMVKNKCASLEEVLALTSTNPAKCLQIDHRKGKVESGYDADLILMNNRNYEIENVFQHGVLVR